MKLTPQELAQATRSIRPSREAALAYLAARILKLERIKPDSARLPELQAAKREIETHLERYE